MADPAKESRDSYFRAYNLYKKQRWEDARQEFLRTIGLLRLREPKVSGKDRHFISLGYCDIYYHLALISLMQGNTHEACSHLEYVVNTMATLPADWQTWRINLLLPQRFTDATKRFQDCKQLPTHLSVALKPKAVKEPKPTDTIKEPKFELRLDSSSTEWSTVKMPVALYVNRVYLRVSATGYVPVEKDVKIERWQPTNRITIQLEKLPAIVPPPPRKPPTPPIKLPPPPPSKISPWVWVGIGSVAALATGAIVAGILISRSNYPSKVNIVIESNL